MHASADALSSHRPRPTLARQAAFVRGPHVLRCGRHRVLPTPRPTTLDRPTVCASWMPGACGTRWQAVPCVPKRETLAQPCVLCGNGRTDSSAGNATRHACPATTRTPMAARPVPSRCSTRMVDASPHVPNAPSPVLQGVIASVLRAASVAQTASLRVSPRLLQRACLPSTIIFHVLSLFMFDSHSPRAAAMHFPAWLPWTTHLVHPRLVRTL